MNLIFKLFASFIFLLVLSGCANKNSKDLSFDNLNKIINKDSSLKLRQIQTKSFYKIEKKELQKAIINVMLDEGYFLNFIDFESGIVSGVSKKENLQMKLTISYTQKKDSSYLVRLSNAIEEKSNYVSSYQILKDEKVYEYLFDRLRHSIFIEQNIYAKKTYAKSKKKKVQKTYSLQFTSTLKKNSAKKVLSKVESDFENARISKLKKYYVVRAGNFKSFKEAKTTLAKNKQYKNAIIVSTLN